MTSGSACGNVAILHGPSQKKILEKAKLMADDGGEAGQQQAALRREFESLLSMMFNTDNVMDKNDIKRLKERWETVMKYQNVRVL